MFNVSKTVRTRFSAIIGSAAVITALSIGVNVHAQTAIATSAPTMALTAIATTSATQPAVMGWPRTITDEVGNKVTLNAAPIRIVSATLGTDEMLFSLVDPSRLAAITANAVDPGESNVVEQAKSIKVQLKTPLDPEQVIALKPDLVLVASYNDPAALKQLQSVGLPVVEFANFNSIKDIEGNVTLLGQLTGTEDKAAQVVANMESRLAKVADAVKNVQPKLSVLYYGSGGYSEGPGSTVDEVLTRAGAINAVTQGGIKDQYPTLSDEFVVQQDPDVILLSGVSFTPDFPTQFKTNAKFANLKAVKNNQVFAANDVQVSAVSQYVVDGVESVAALLYPKAYQIPATPIATMSVTMNVTMAGTMPVATVATMSPTMVATP